ncbi:ABC transporter ATP-binding protein [Desulfurobacterium sp.]
MLLEINNVKYKNILKGVSLKAKAGEITGIVGKNGSGKSTLLKAISGFLKYNGEITISGKEIKNLPTIKRIKNVNLLPQEFPVSSLTVKEILEITARLAQISAKKIDGIIGKYNLKRQKDQPLLTLSGGEKVRLFLARLEIINPEVILLDEPSAFLDIEVLKELKSFVLKMKELKKIVIIVSNDLNFILNIADSIVGIKEGNIVSNTGAIDEFLASVYDCSVKIVKINGRKQVVI